MLRNVKRHGRKLLLGSLLVVLLLLGSALTYTLANQGKAARDLTYGSLMTLLAVDDPAVRLHKVQVTGGEVLGELHLSDTVSDGSLQPQTLVEDWPFRSRTVRGGEKSQIDQLLLRGGAKLQGEDEKSFLDTYPLLLPNLLFFAALASGFFLIRWLSGGGPLTFGRSKHKLYADTETRISFADVAGIDEAVAELREIVDFLQNPGKYQALGGRIPKGVLLVGPPGTGKTLLAKAVAGEAGTPFFSMSGSDFVEMFVGVGASRVRDLFAQAESRAPCIIFIDELDALGKARGGSAVGGHDEREQTLNALLVEMDGFGPNRGVLLMAATNRPETLDAALLRPGRFDRQVVVDRPNVNGREAILKVHIRDVKLAGNVDLRQIASLTSGSVGADLANLVNEATLLAARKNKDAVDMADFNEAVERGAIGLERKSRIMLPEEKLRVAYHEGGHALVACALPNTYPVHKVTIIPRGVGALGYVLRRPDDDRYLHTRGELESNIKVALAGTLAEEMVYREISNGASSDLDHANGIARRMVKEFGMSRLGRVFYRDDSAGLFLPGTGEGGARQFSEQTAREIDLEVRKIIEEAAAEVRIILNQRKGALDALAQLLIDKEIVDGTELQHLLEAHDPGPRLVPGSTAIAPPDPPAHAPADNLREGELF